MEWGREEILEENGRIGGKRNIRNGRGEEIKQRNEKRKMKKGDRRDARRRGEG